MAWLAVEKNGIEIIQSIKPIRGCDVWLQGEWYYSQVELPKGTIEKLIGRKLTWEDEPVEIK